MNASESLDLQTAADELGVHYQTAYRWVRTGRLPALLIAGRYSVERADLAAFDQARHTPTNPIAPSAPRLDRSADRVHEALINGDEPTVGQITRKLVDEGSSLIDVIQGVFVPSLRRIGQSWHDGELPVWVEHRASAIVERVLGEHAPNPRGRRRGTAVVAALSGDRHSLPTTMAAIALREDNWHVHHLGADTPPDDIVQICAQHDITLTVLTVTLSELAGLAKRTADHLRTAGTATLIGGTGGTLHTLVAEARLNASTARRGRQQPASPTT